MPSHLIIGYSDWGKKIASFLIKQKIYNKIYIINTKEFFEIYPKYKILKRKNFIKESSKINTVHICSSVKTHLKYYKLFQNKNLIIEKPIVDNLKELDKFKRIYQKKKQKTLVNYTDLFSDKLKKLKRRDILKNIKQINLFYSKKSKIYSNKIDFFNDWLDHPLSIVLFLFGKINNNKIFIQTEKSKTSKFKGTLNILYYFRKIKIKISISNFKKRDQRLITIKDNFKSYNINLKNKNSFKNIYSNLLKKKVNLSHQNLKFHEKIFREKQIIIDKIKKL